jgi:hypothetical protein
MKNFQDTLILKKKKNHYEFQIPSKNLPNWDYQFECEARFPGFIISHALCLLSQKNIDNYYPNTLTMYLTNATITLQSHLIPLSHRHPY